MSSFLVMGLILAGGIIVLAAVTAWALCRMLAWTNAQQPHVDD